MSLDVPSRHSSHISLKPPVLLQRKSLLSDHMTQTSFRDAFHIRDGSARGRFFAPQCALKLSENGKNGRWVLTG
jgi:hypothetical protein